MKIQVLKARRRAKRKAHIRAKVSGTSSHPRLTIFKSLNQFYAQIIDDVDGKTLVSASTIDKDIRGQVKDEMTKTDKSVLVGSAIAKRALDANIKRVAFDRNGYIYHGRVKAFADAVREAGLQM